MAVSRDLKVRPFLLSDLPAAASVGAAAMQEDELFTYLCPYRKDYPESFRQYFFRNLKTRYCSDDHIMWVAEIAWPDTAQRNGRRREVVAYTAYSRKSPNKDAMVISREKSWLDGKFGLLSHN